MDNLSELEKELKKVVGNVRLAMEDSAPDSNMTTEGTSLRTGLNLEGLVHALLSNYMKLDKRLSAVEAKVMTMDLTKPGERSNAAFIHENKAGDRQSDQGIPGRIPVVRTRVIKDRMIEEQQERRERTHDAVEDVEVYVEGQLCPSCNRGISKWCFIGGCFDWCFAHSAICTGDNGQVTKHVTSPGKDEYGNIVIKTFTEEVALCNSEEAGADCDIFSCEYSRGEWQEEEWNDLMARQSP